MIGVDNEFLNEYIIYKKIYRKISSIYSRLKPKIIRILKNENLYNEYNFYLKNNRNNIISQLRSISGIDFKYSDCADNLDNENYIIFQIYYYNVYVENSSKKH